MGIEGVANRYKANSRESITLVIKTTDAVVRELVTEGPLERKSRAAQRVVERILNANNRGKKVVVTGETKAVTVWIDEVKVGWAEVR